MRRAPSVGIAPAARCAYADEVDRRGDQCRCGADGTQCAEARVTPNAAPPSTQNRDQAFDSETHQAENDRTQAFDLKAHIGSLVRSGLAQTVIATAGILADSTYPDTCTAARRGKNRARSRCRPER